jgi:hypothetical protein
LDSPQGGLAWEFRTSFSQPELPSARWPPRRSHSPPAPPPRPRRRLNAGEKIKASELAPLAQKRTLYPAKRVNASGVIVMTVTAEVKGKHVWTFTGRSSRRTAKASYTVK